MINQYHRKQFSNSNDPVALFYITVGNVRNFIWCETCKELSYMYGDTAISTTRHYVNQCGHKLLK